MIRIIPRLDVKGDVVVKGIYYEGWRKVGDPKELINKYEKAGADEIIYIDIFASLTNRTPKYDVISKMTEDLKIPIAVGGGIWELDEARMVLNRGGDKVIVNTGALRKPELIKEIADEFGSQSVIVSIEAKKRNCGYECYYDHGREPSGVYLDKWLRIIQKMEPGEIFISSIDKDGALRGPDLKLIDTIVKEIDNIPLIVSSGIRGPEDALEIVSKGENITAIAIGSALHYGKTSIREIKEYLRENGYSVRL